VWAPSRRRPVIVEADGRWFVGPDHGLFHVVARRATAPRYWVIGWRPERLSASLRGRDLFAPVAARLVRAEPPQDPAKGCVPEDFKDWPDDLPEVIYIDDFGSAMTGIRASVLPQDARLKVRGNDLERARTFGEVAPGTGFWYKNANGLADLLPLNPGPCVEAGTPREALTGGPGLGRWVSSCTMQRIQGRGFSAGRMGEGAGGRSRTTKVASGITFLRQGVNSLAL